MWMRSTLAAQRLTATQVGAWVGDRDLARTTNMAAARDRHVAARAPWGRGTRMDGERMGCDLGVTGACYNVTPALRQGREL